MKRSTSFPEEQFMKKSNRICTGKFNPKNLERLVFIADVDTLQIKFTNLSGQNYLDSVNKNASENLFQEFIHPEDYAAFVQHFQPNQNLEDYEEQLLRIKSNSGSWINFLFRNRFYEGNEDNRNQYILIIAEEIKIRNKNQRNALPQPILEKALSVSYDKYGALLESINDGFFLVDVLFDAQKKPFDALIIEANKIVQAQLNIQDLEQRTLREIVPEYSDSWIDHFGEIALHMEPEQFRSSMTNPCSTALNISGFPVGEVCSGQVGVLFTEVPSENSEVKQNTRITSLENDLQLLQTLFENSTIGLSVLKPIYNNEDILVDFQYLRVNKITRDIYKQDPVGKRYSEINANIEENGKFGIIKRVMCGGNPEDFEIQKRWEASRYFYKVSARKENGLLILSMEDISHRKSKSQRLRENVRFKKQIAETSPDIIMILNLQQDHVRYINRNIAKRPGMRKREIDGMSLSCIIPFIHPHDREKAIDFHLKLTTAEDREILDVEFRMKSHEENWEWFNARGKVFMRNKEKKVCEYILLLRNIEQQKRTQMALLHAEKLSIKGEVARTLAHELRNPMASIRMAADILAQKTAGNGKKDLSSYISLIKRSTGILNRLVTDLLNSSNYSPFSPVKCCLAKTLEEALKAAGDRIYLTGIKVVKDYEGNYNIYADPEKLKIALLNIIVNASEAMNPNEGVLHLKITRNPEDHELVITDNGCGMEKSQLDKLFDAFYTRKPQGVGIGLSSVKSILEDHNAKVMVDSKLNDGTSFHLTFQSYESFERT